jgi:uncharacterized Rossmann fold enzyme
MNYEDWKTKYEEILNDYRSAKNDTKELYERLQVK